MTNYLKIKPDQVKYWAKLSAFIFTLVPIVINKEKKKFLEEYDTI